MSIQTLVTLRAGKKMTHRERALLLIMANLSIDGVYSGGWDVLAELMGYERGTANATEKIRRTLAGLIRAGMIKRMSTAMFGMLASYEIVIDSEVTP